MAKPGSGMMDPGLSPSPMSRRRCRCRCAARRFPSFFKPMAHSWLQLVACGLSLEDLHAVASSTLW